MRLTQTTRRSLLVVAVTVGLLILATRWIQHRLPPNAITITSSKSTYTIGETVELLVINNTTRPLRVENKCPKQPLDISRQENGRWNEQEAEADDLNCRETATELAPNVVRHLSYAPWQTKLFSTPGTYKAELEVEGYETHYSTTFEITN